MTSPTPQSPSFLSNLVENLHQVKAAMKTTKVETNNVPGLTSAVRGQEGRGETYKTINSMMRERFFLDPTSAGRNASPAMGGFPGRLVEKEASTALVRAMRKALLSAKDITRAAQAMKPGTSRFVKHLDRGQFNIADEMVGNIAGKGRAAVRKLPSFNYARLKDAYTPIQADIRKMNKMFPQSTGNPLIAEYLNIGRKGAFQQLADQATDLKNVLPELNSKAFTYPGDFPKSLLGKIKNQMWDVRPGNTGIQGQIFDYISKANPGVGTVPYKTTRLFNVKNWRPGNSWPAGLGGPHLRAAKVVPHPNPVVAPPRKALDVKVGPSHPQGMNDPRDGHWVDDLLANRGLGDVGTNAHINNLIRKHWLGGGSKTGADATEKHAEMQKEGIIPLITGALGSLGTALSRGISGESQGIGKDMAQGFWNYSGASMLPSNLVNSDLGDAKTGWMPSMWGTRGDYGSQYGMSNAQRGAYKKMTPKQQKQYATTFMDGKSKKWEHHPAARTNKPGWADRFFGAGMGSVVTPGGAIAQSLPQYSAGGSAYKNSISPPFAQFEGTQSYGKDRSWADRAKASFNVQDNTLGTFRQNALNQRPASPQRASRHPGVNLNINHPGGFKAQPWQSADDSARLREKGGADEGSSGFLATLLRNLRDASFVGAGGVSAGTAGDFLRRQLKHIKQYNPTIVSASPDRLAPKSVLKHVLPKLREGDVLVHGDMPIDVKEVARQKHLLKLRKELNRQLRAAGGKPKSAPMSAIKLQAEKLVRAVTDMGSGGMGGFDEHAKIFTRPKRHGIESYGQLRSVTPTYIPDNPKGRRTPWVPAAEKLRKNLASGRGRRKFFRDPVEGIKRVYKRYQNAQMQARKPVPQRQLNKLLSDTIEGSDELLSLAGKQEPTPFSIMRPKKYSQQKAHKYMRQVANTTVDSPDTWQAAIQRRLMPRWASDLIEKVRTKIRPGASQQGTNCAGGVCKAIMGKGTYNLPSDFRQMKEFDTVMDVMPENALKRMGGTPKNLEPVRKIMRRGAFRGSLPGVLGGLGLMGLGAYGAMKRSSDELIGADSQLPSGGVMDDGSLEPHYNMFRTSWRPEKTVKDRFGAPNQSKLINNIVRSKSRNQGRDFRDSIPAASQKKAPKQRRKPRSSHVYPSRNPNQPQSLPPIPPTPAPKLDHLFKKDGTPIDAWSAQRKMIN